MEKKSVECIMIRARFGAIPVLCLLSVMLIPMLFISGCGKKANPVPDNSRQSFVWHNVFAQVVESGCVSITGSAGGATHNMSIINLELQPYAEGCEVCPFVPQESAQIPAVEAWESPGGNTFRFTHCPAVRAGVYRWRLAGIHTMPGMPVIITPVRVTGANP